MSGHFDWELASKRDIVWARGAYNRGADVRSGDEFLKEIVSPNNPAGGRPSKRGGGSTVTQGSGKQSACDETHFPTTYSISGAIGNGPRFAFKFTVVSKFEDQLLDVLLLGERIESDVWDANPAACQSLRDRFFSAATKAFVAAKNV